MTDKTEKATLSAYGWLALIAPIVVSIQVLIDPGLPILGWAFRSDEVTNFVAMALEIAMIVMLVLEMKNPIAVQAIWEQLSNYLIPERGSIWAKNLKSSPSWIKALLLFIYIVLLVGLAWVSTAPVFSDVVTASIICTSHAVFASLCFGQALKEKFPTAPSALHLTGGFGLASVGFNLVTML